MDILGMTKKREEKEQQRLDRQHKEMLQGNQRKAERLLAGFMAKMAELGFELLPEIEPKVHEPHRISATAVIGLRALSRGRFEAEVVSPRQRAEQRQIHREATATHGYAGHEGAKTAFCLTCHPELRIRAEHCASDACVENEPCSCACDDCVTAIVEENVSELRVSIGVNEENKQE